MTLSRTAIEIKGKLIARNARASDEWISACVDFFLSEMGNVPVSELIEKVHEQWLLADLRDVGTKSLPPNLGGLRSTELRGKYILQINGVQDVGQPAFSQIQKIRKHDIENVEFSNQEKKNDTNFWEPKSTRCMMFALTDGDQEVKGMELEMLPMLGLNLIPGTKIVVQGPVDCRRGILLLRPKNVSVLGGEVDSLVITNAAENILARKLNLPENPTPYADDALLVTAASESARTQTQSVSQAPGRTSPPPNQRDVIGGPTASSSRTLAQVQPVSRQVAIERSTAHSNRKEAPPIATTNRMLAAVVSRPAAGVPENRVTSAVVVVSDDEDDFDLAGVDIDSVCREAEMKHQIALKSPLRGETMPPFHPPPQLQRQESNRPNLSSLRDRMAKENVGRVQISERHVAGPSKAASSSASAESQSLLSSGDERDPLNSVFQIDSYVWKIENFIVLKPTSFGKVLKCHENQFKGDSHDVLMDSRRRCAWFRVHSYFTTIVTKLMVDKEMKWTMAVKVSDGDVSVTAQLSHEIMQFLLKLDPLEVRRRVKTDLEGFKADLQEIREKFKERLIRINSSMIYAWPLDDPRPIIMEIEEVTKEKLGQ